MKITRLDNNFHSVIRRIANKKEVSHGVIQLISGKFQLASLIEKNSNLEELTGRDIVFEGASRLDSKRAMLRYWTRHQERLDLDFEQFRQRCRLQSDNRTIVFRA